MDTAAVPEPIDWSLVTSVALRLLPAGPRVTAAEARATVAQLRACAAAAEEHVSRFTSMVAPAAAGPLLVVDRPGWVRANVSGLRAVTRPLLDGLVGLAGAPNPFPRVAAVLTSTQIAGALAFLGSRVLGQYEIFAPADDGRSRPGRLLLVAPNIVRTERDLGVDPADFRLWVCLHEETHRVQFTAVRWLRDHLENELRTLLGHTQTDLPALLGRAREAAGSLAGGGPTPSLLELVQSPAQRTVLARITAVMSLLEGHAEYVMDGVGPAVVPSVGLIRERFARRRQARGRLDALLRQLLGVEAKLQQYARGERFVREVVDRVGMAGFNRVWTSPNTLPALAEIAEPDRWVERMHRVG